MEMPTQLAQFPQFEVDYLDICRESTRFPKIYSRASIMKPTGYPGEVRLASQVPQLSRLK